METDSSLLQAVAVLILLGAAVPLIKPRLPLPAKNAVAGEKKADDDAVESEGEKAVDPPTAKKLLRNLGLWVFMVANSKSCPSFLLFHLLRNRSN
jgi:hypothetical protein